MILYKTKLLHFNMLAKNLKHSVRRLFVKPCLYYIYMFFIFIYMHLMKTHLYGAERYVSPLTLDILEF